MYCSKWYYILVVIVLVGITGCPVVTIKPITASVKHVTCADPKSGSIDQTVIPAFSSFSVDHVWNNGATDEDISGLGCIYPAFYMDNVTMVQGSNQPMLLVEKYDILYNVKWSKLDQMGYDELLDKTYKTSSNQYIRGTAFSENILPENVNGYLDFNVKVADSEVDDWALVGFNNTAAYNSYPAINTFTGFILEVRGSETEPWPNIGNFFVWVNGAPVAGLPDFYFKNNARFSVKYTNTGIVFYHNNSEVYRTTAAALFSHPRKFVQATIAQQNIFLTQVHSTFGCTDKATAYAELSKTLDASCYIMSNTLLFRYKEKYNDISVNCKVYDWERNVVLTATSTTSNNNGVNYHSVNTNNALVNGEVYIMEATNAKGEIYKMRFRYNNYKEKTFTAVKGPPFPKGDIKEGANFTFGNDYE